MNPLRNQFDQYMIVNRLADNTREIYINAIAGLAKYFNRSPDTLTEDQIQDYLLYIINVRALAWSTCNVFIAACCCFFMGFLKWDDIKLSLPPRPRDRRLPTVLSVNEVKTIIEAAANLKHRTLLMTVYCAGLRVSEVVALQPHHIQSGRMMIQAKQGKGRKDRYTILTEDLLEQLRHYWKKRAAGQLAFPQQ